MTTYYTIGAKGSESAINDLRTFLLPGIIWEKRGDITECWLRIDLSDTTHCLQWDWSGDEPISVGALDTGLYQLSFSGEQTGAPFAEVHGLSLQFPDLEWFLSATTEQEDHEYWIAKNGELRPIDLYTLWMQEGVRMTFVRHGKELVPPEFEGDMMDGNDDPVQITSEQLAESCKSLYRAYLGQEYPGDKTALLRKATEFVSSRMAEIAARREASGAAGTGTND